MKLREVNHSESHSEQGAAEGEGNLTNSQISVTSVPRVQGTENQRMPISFPAPPEMIRCSTSKVINVNLFRFPPNLACSTICSYYPPLPFDIAANHASYLWTGHAL